MEDKERMSENIRKAAAAEAAEMAEAEEREVATSSATEATETAKAEEPTVAAAPDQKTAAEILHEMDALALRMGVFSEGIDYLIESGAPDEIITGYLERTDKAAAESIADELRLEGEERERFLNRETRTPEERDLVQHVSLKSWRWRLDKYLKSNYLHSLGIIAEAASKALGVDYASMDFNAPQYAPFQTALNMLNRYFYIELHKEIVPLTAKSLSEAEEEELRNLARDYIAFHKQQKKAPPESVVDFISPAMGEIIELTGLSDMTYLPISLAFRDQRSIAKSGSTGMSINVGKHTEAGRVDISVFISDKDGKPLTIDAIMQGVQAAIGQLIDENGRVLPITVTPQQVYRAYARLPNDAKVTEQQAAEVERAMDALMFSPSFLDFTAQLERHKKIKQQPDYDYTGKEAGRLSGTLIPARKGEATDRLGVRRVSYKIYDYPVLYRYSHVIGQIAQVSNKLLTGDDKGAIKDKVTAEAQRNALNIGMRRVVLARITLWRSRLKQHKPINSALKIQEIAEDCNITLTDKTERTLRKNITQYLDELKSQKAIKDYQPQKYGRRIIGYYVYFK